MKPDLNGRKGINLAYRATTMPSPREFRQRSFAFACDIVRLYRRLEKTVPHTLARQVLRSGTSIGANLEEAKVAQSRKDLTSKFSIALKEARETHYWLRLLAATDLVPPPLVEKHLEEANQFIAMLTTSVRNLRRQKRRERATQDCT